jgi:hypothetical protein
MWFVCAFGEQLHFSLVDVGTRRSKGELAMAIISSRKRHRVPLWGAIVFAGTALASLLSAAPAGALAATQPHAAASFAVNGFFNGVTATSASDAWAVGGNNGITLIAHWNGTGWKQVPSPNGSNGANFLEGVAATSASNAWAVGSDTTNSSPGGEPLIERWNGSTWKVVAAPTFSGLTNILYGVAATSASNAWAVGSYDNSSSDSQSLILHWNGTTWKKVPSPDPSTQFTVLYGVTAMSATNAWAVGTADFSPLILHWDGTSWQQVPSPATPAFDTLYGVAASSATNAWAVGSDSVKGTLSFHWNGTTWTQTTGPSASLDLFTGVAATSATSPWAVGSADNSTLIARWNGTTWKQVPSPNPTKVQVHAFNGVAATSATNAWAVGHTSTNNGGNEKTLIAHWNGTSWK